MADFYMEPFEVEELADTFDVFEEEEAPKEPEEPEELEVSEPDETMMVEEPERVPGADIPFQQYVKDEPEQKIKDWENDHDPSRFVEYLKLALTKLPQHSGNTIPGCERVLSRLKDLKNQASKAMRSDYDGVIDEMELDKILKDIDNMIFRLENHIERLQKNAGQSRVRFISQDECEKCGSIAPMWHDAATGQDVCMSCEGEKVNEGLEKTAGTAVLNVYMTPWERAVIATCINATVSGGKNINEVFDHMNKKYKFSDREKLAFVQLLSDHGYPMGLTDRGRVGEDEVAPEDFIEFNTNYRS